MAIPTFHDGYFDGLRLRASKVAHLYLRTVDGQCFTLILHGVERLAVSEVRQGNIIFDIVVRGPEELTCSDIGEAFGVGADTEQAMNLLHRTRQQGLQLLEINASYGAHGVALFQTYEMSPS